MALNPRIWYPIAAILCAANVLGAAFAALPGEALHVTAHAALAVGFGLWAQHLKGRLRARVSDGAQESEIAALRDEVEELRQELSELQERMDFAERLLSQARDLERLPEPQPRDRA